ncbi:MAG: citrate/2-methylcitrate synthase [Lachnospiraceae bacterium]|nr:citrate/2-methylcitrate synthase [Lachnospiraceae bacterium]
MEKDFAEFNDRLDKLADQCLSSRKFDLDLYAEYDVKRGLRDSDGKGVVTGLTEISDVIGFASKRGRVVPVDGRLYFQGYDIHELIRGSANSRFGFEEAAYLLLFGDLPTQTQLDEFIDILGNYRALPDNFVRDIIMQSPTDNMMNILQKSVLTLYSYDDAPEDISVKNVLRQSLQLLARLPLISVYGYHSYRHYVRDKSLVIRRSKPSLSTAENILNLLRQDGEYTPLEAKVLDILLILHAEHGGGNNSSFTTHVLTSTGTDTFSTVAASLGSLKGPRHGGANIKVMQMFKSIIENVEDWTDEDALREYLLKILRGEAFDGAGLIYGIGHAVYTLSDPRCVILKKYAKWLSEEKNLTNEFELLDRIERIAIELMKSERQFFKPICANVDFYSGFVYSMLGIPSELVTPIFAIARMAGWSAHRLEELANDGKIIRPAYKYVGHHADYIPMEDRN